MTLLERINHAVLASLLDRAAKLLEQNECLYCGEKEPLCPWCESRRKLLEEIKAQRSEPDNARLETERRSEADER